MEEACGQAGPLRPQPRRPRRPWHLRGSGSPGRSGAHPAQICLHQAVEVAVEHGVRVGELLSTAEVLDLLIRLQDVVAVLTPEVERATRVVSDSLNGDTTRTANEQFALAA